MRKVLETSFGHLKGTTNYRWKLRPRVEALIVGAVLILLGHPGRFSPK